MIETNFAQVKNAAVWSGDQNVPIDYGKVYVSLNFPTGTAESTKTETRNNIVSNFTDTLGVMSIETEFVDPVDVFIETIVNFDFDPSLTGFTLTSTENSIYNYLNFPADGRCLNSIDDVIDLSIPDINIKYEYLPSSFKCHNSVMGVNSETLNSGSELIIFLGKNEILPNFITKK